MTVIFQLFCAEDLQRLSLEQLTKLRDTLATTLGLKPNPPCRTAEGCAALPLRASDNLNLPSDAPADVIVALKQRFDEVSQQLKSPPADSSPFNFDAFKKRHFNELDSDEKAKETTILEWAVSCEVNNFNFYDHLRRARDKAYQMFEEWTGGQRPKGPDSVYSPFNLLHPLYNTFPPPPMKPTPPQSTAGSTEGATSGGSVPPAVQTATQGPASSSS
jgi:hypothetical protein